MKYEPVKWCDYRGLHIEVLYMYKMKMGKNEIEQRIATRNFLH